MSLSHTKLIKCDKASWLRPTDSGTNCLELWLFMAQKKLTQRGCGTKVWKAPAVCPQIKIFLFSNHTSYTDTLQTLFGNQWDQNESALFL